jgi:hypothetical protein
MEKISFFLLESAKAVISGGYFIKISGNDISSPGNDQYEAC